MGKRCGATDECANAAVRAFATKILTLSGSLRPGAASTPETTSMPHGFSVAIASATLSGVRPPAAMYRRSFAFRKSSFAARFQS